MTQPAHPAFAWLPPRERRAVLDMLEGPMPRGREQLIYRTRPEHLDRPLVDGRRHLVFVTYYPYPAIIKKSLALRRSGRFHTTLLACCIREDLRIGEWFDQVYEVADFTEFLDLLGQAAPTAISVSIQPSALAALILEAAPDCRVVVDITDSQYFMQRDPESAPCVLEREVLRQADALTHKMPPEAMDAIRRAWGLDQPDTLAHSLPCRDFFAHGEPPVGGPWRLVYAGGVMPYRIAVASGHENQVFDPLVTRTAGLDLELRFLVNQNARNMHWEDQERYVALTAHYPHFHFQPGVPFHALPAAIADCHYGLLYDNMRISSYREEAYWYNMSTKVFSYLEAGLPILVYDDFRYIARMVEEHGLGLTYSLDRIEEIPDLLARADYPSLRANVRRYRESYELATLAPALEKLYTPAPRRERASA